MCAPSSASNLPLADASCACCSSASNAATSPADHSSTDNAVTTRFEVAGMTCGHCVASVTKEVSQLAGVTNVTVDLVAGGTSTVSVTSATAVDPDAVASAIDEAGYELVPAAR
jgi:copper chaperone